MKKIIFKIFGGIIKTQVTGTKKQLNLHEPEAALGWINAFESRLRAEKKADVHAAQT